MQGKKGFTLLELLITIGIISILSGITIFAINPSKQFGQANDAKRLSDINSILSAIGQYTIKHRGAVPSGLTSDYQRLANTGTGLDLCSELVEEDFLNLFPVDPSLNLPFVDCATNYDTGYELKYQDGHVYVHAPLSQESGDLTVSY